MTDEAQPLSEGELAQARDYVVQEHEEFGVPTDGPRLYNERILATIAHRDARISDLCQKLEDLGIDAEGWKQRATAAEAHARTPGTVEVCAYEAEHIDHGRCPDDRSSCTRSDCPIRSKEGV